VIFQNATTTFARQKKFVIDLLLQQDLDKHTLTPTEKQMRTTAIYFGIMEFVNIADKMKTITS
jgi:hypothetical protein